MAKTLILISLSAWLEAIVPGACIADGYLCINDVNSLPLLILKRLKSSLTHQLTQATLFQTVVGHAIKQTAHNVCDMMHIKDPLLLIKKSSSIILHNKDRLPFWAHLDAMSFCIETNVSKHPSNIKFYLLKRFFKIMF